jgi:beta-N-acetylhexosaminidase
MLLICNDRPAAEAVVDEIAAPAEPVAQLRLMRLHGRAAPDRGALVAGERWRRALELLEGSLGKPDFSLRA